MNDQDIQEMTEVISRQSFGRPFRHRAYFNHRLRTTGGRYMLASHNIEINYKQFEKFGKQAVIDIIKHELCHYHLHLEQKGYQHRDRDFKALSKQVGAPRYCTPVQSYADRVNYVYQCKRCGVKFHRIRRVDTRRRVCGQCGGRLKLVEGRK
ncbi:SprT family protein [Staphylococcus pettenkoferi]|uniref:SprT family protein n=1 Tax=Staphylococcus pettenkoferi TaxID=170573 RepID=UPI0002432D3F|nr:SprT family protein [Staphylococcus pettenkoferi]ASE36535.1 SprT family protein [Staphylococcus pettenkoferi]EHM72117.1 SprT-like family protein [Staphylococcus pettenkoferi VCU012]MCY1581933.1 SprT family protein [Staphylococcus pettenkoferi]